MIGFNNLSNLITNSYVNLDDDNKFVVLKSDLAKKSEGLIALSGSIYGDLANSIKSGKNDLIMSSINYWKKNFPDSFYIEITRTGKDFEDEYKRDTIQSKDVLMLDIILIEQTFIDLQTKILLII